MRSEASTAPLTLNLDAPLLEAILDRESIETLEASLSSLFDVPVRVVSIKTDPATLPQPSAGARVHTFPVEVGGLSMAWVVVGPYVPPDHPASTLPRCSELRALALVDHARVTLDLLLDRAFRAAATSTLHASSLRESHREISAKTAALEEAMTRLSELERLKTNFLATISHELRTPLTSIIGYSEMLAEGIGGSLTAEQREFVDTVRQKSVQLLELILRLLDLSKLESGAAALIYADVVVSDLVSEMIEASAPAAAKKSVRVVAVPESERLAVIGDRERLRQIARHLIDNAIKFCEAGGEVRVSVQAAARSSHDDVGAALLLPVRDVVELRVADTGTGIPETDRQRIFDPFFQLDQSPTRRHGGAGVGLAIVRRLVEAHGGTVHVEANAPRGSVFVVGLPRANGPPSSDRS